MESLAETRQIHVSNYNNCKLIFKKSRRPHVGVCVTVRDCEVTEWGPWSSCSAECGTGVMTRDRAVRRQPENGGTPCPELRQERTCSGQRCELRSSDHVYKASINDTSSLKPGGLFWDFKNYFYYPYTRGTVHDNHAARLCTYKCAKALFGYFHSLVRTISRRLVANGLHSCRPLRRLPLTPPNRRQRLEWGRARSTWMTEWHRVVFSDDSRFCLSSDSRRVSVWRRRGERSNPAAIVERPTVRQRGIMVWGAIAYDSRSPLLRIQGTMTAQRYVDDVLRPVTLPYLQGVPNALYQQDNARPHTARISQQALQDVQMLPWPPYSPDLSPIEHVWDIIGRRLHALPQPRSEDELWQMRYSYYNRNDTKKICMAPVIPVRRYNYCNRNDTGRISMAPVIPVRRYNYCNRKDTEKISMAPVIPVRRKNSYNRNDTEKISKAPGHHWIVGYLDRSLYACGPWARMTRKIVKQAAMILPAAYSTPRVVNASTDIRKNLRLKYPKDPIKETSKEYCVVFEVTKVRKECESEEALTKGSQVCVRCERAAWRKHLGYRCNGHGVVGKQTRWITLPKTGCTGRWMRKEVSDNCPCHTTGQPDFIFV
ncbi:hypothetical protein LAZ67_2004441 [Cordylochernes scorpioides]|uniref:Uncharacterized protein n=1 Tax=Cordylochernes scorpioides TaxID=51811 RepID=A0ABY6K4T2_9ARAC|nr:hypothetical protein LAZ67_2004441 [Cordylochernes scorpioides]